MPRLTIIESPYYSRTAKGLMRNQRYLHACIKDSIARGEVPFAAHGFFTHYLNDRDPGSRATGFRLGRSFYFAAATCALYCDLGTSPGMLEGYTFASRLGLSLEERLIGMDWDAKDQLS